MKYKTVQKLSIVQTENMNKEIPTVSTKRAILGDGGTGVAGSRDGAFIVDFQIDSQMFSIVFNGLIIQCSIMVAVIKWRDAYLSDQVLVSCIQVVDTGLLFRNFEEKYCK